MAEQRTDGRRVSRAFDITGKRFGRWTVVERNGTKPSGDAVWQCRCDCGTVRDVGGAQLRFARSLSCGCLRTEAMSESRRASGRMRAAELSGERFGRLVALRRDGSTKGGQARWQCKCDCGNECVTLTAYLRSGHTQSCGCLSVDTTTQRLTRHGEGARGKTTAEYRAHRHIIDRCHNANSPEYQLYGARGLRVCARWRASFEAFRDDMGRRPSDKTSIDRIDNARGYECGRADCLDCGPSGAILNARWASAAEQNRNKSNNRMVPAFGENISLAAWNERFGVPAVAITRRIDRLRWSPERAVSEPARLRQRPAATQLKAVTETPMSSGDWLW